MKKTPIESTLAELMNVASIPAPAPRCCGGSEFITPALFGEEKRPMPITVQEQDEREPDVRETDRKRDQEGEAERGEQHPPGRERARAVPVGKPAGGGPAIRKPAISGIM